MSTSLQHVLVSSSLLFKPAH